METQKVFLKEKSEKHIMCFSNFSFRNTFCVSMGKTLWKSQNVSLNGFFQGKHHPVPAVLEEAKAALAKSKDDMMLYYNWKQTPALEFKAGDMVFLDASNVQTTRPSRKLSHRRLGLFPIDSQVGNGAYWLRLPPSMSQLHPVFNVVKLSLAPLDPIPG